MADRKRTLKFAFTTVAIVGLALLVIVFLRFRRHQGGALTMPAPAVKALMTLAKVHQVATKDGRVQWELDAASAQLETDGGRMILASPKVQFHLEDGTTVHLTAEQGILYTRTNDMEVTGNVRLSNDRYTLMAQALIYRHGERLLLSDSPVEIKSATMDLRAEHMKYRLDDHQAQFDGHVKGTLDDRLDL